MIEFSAEATGLIQEPHDDGAPRGGPEEAVNQGAAFDAAPTPLLGDGAVEGASPKRERGARAHFLELKYAARMSTARSLHYSYAEYLDALKMSELKLEYLGGEIFAMAGGTPEHGIAAARLIQLLGARLPAACQVMTSDVKIRVQATGLSTFPDLSVVCGSLERAADDPNAVVNPTLLVEVLSPSTEEYDRGEKLRHYQQLPSLQAVLLVGLEARRVTLVRRTAGGWTSSDHGDSVELPGLGHLELRSLWS